jgi:ABC-type hemin transport system ATPase subunit
MISVEQIKYSVGVKNILNNISIQFLPGTCNLIIGPNGSGKSTLIKLLSGELDNYDGRVIVEEKNNVYIMRGCLHKFWKAPMANSVIYF